MEKSHFANFRIDDFPCFASNFFLLLLNPLFFFVDWLPIDFWGCGKCIAFAVFSILYPRTMKDFSYEISKKSICTKTSRDHFDLKRSFLINFSPRKTVNNLFDAVFRALSNGVFKIVKLASLYEKTSSKKLSQFLVDIR